MRYKHPFLDVIDWYTANEPAAPIDQNSAQFDIGAQQIDWIGVAAEEFGHALGLDHNPADRSSIISGGGRQGEMHRWLTKHDSLALQHLYGRDESVTLPDVNEEMPRNDFVPASTSEIVGPAFVTDLGEVGPTVTLSDTYTIHSMPNFLTDPNNTLESTNYLEDNDWYKVVARFDGELAVDASARDPVLDSLSLGIWKGVINGTGDLRRDTLLGFDTDTTDEMVTATVDVNAGDIIVFRVFSNHAILSGGSSAASVIASSHTGYIPGGSYTLTTTAIPVPEPGTSFILVSGMMLVFTRRCRRLGHLSTIP